MNIFDKIVDFFYVTDPLPKKENDRNHKRFTNPIFQVHFPSGDIGTTADWSRGGLRLMNLTREYTPGKVFQGTIVHENKRIGNCFLNAVSKRDSVYGTKFKFESMDQEIERQILAILKSQKFH